MSLWTTDVSARVIDAFTEFANPPHTTVDSRTGILNTGDSFGVTDFLSRAGQSCTRLCLAGTINTRLSFGAGGAIASKDTSSFAAKLIVVALGTFARIIDAAALKTYLLQGTTQQITVGFRRCLITRATIPEAIGMAFTRLRRNTRTPLARLQTDLNARST